MNRSITALTITLLLASSPAIAGELDDYYLHQFRETPQTSSGVLSKSAASPLVRKCGMALRHDLKKDWNSLEKSTQKTVAKYLAKPLLANERQYNTAGGHFTIHYSTSLPDAPPLADSNANGVPDWVETVASTFEDVYFKEVTDVNSFGGYTPPPTAPGTRYDIYLQQLADKGEFGNTTSDVLTGQSATSFIVIDNDFSEKLFLDSIPNPGSILSTGELRLRALQITAAHEFHHAIQYGYNYYFDTWYAEATATWMEDEAYDQVNQLYNYSMDYLSSTSSSLDKPVDGGYGRWIFNRAVAETYSPSKIRAIWETLHNTPASNNSDIPMMPVLDAHFKSNSSSLATEFTSFAKKLYTREWTSHTGDLDSLYSTPLIINGTYSQYPVTALTVTLPHYAFVYYRFIPSAAVPDLTITVNKTSGIQAVLLKKSGGLFSTIPAAADGTSFKISAFASLDSASDEAVLILVNTSASDNQQASLSSDGSSQPVTEPTVNPPGTSTPGGSGGCFIATAAYGSYLHPKVMVLREFRDHCLLTNRPGRALVAAYYRISPPIAGLIRKNESLRLGVRLMLSPIILAAEHQRTTLAAAIATVAGAVLLAYRRRRRSMSFYQD